MRTQEEIEFILLETQKELDYVNEWVDKARLKYQKDREFWGMDADRGELNTSHDVQKVLIEKVNVLNWVLNK